MMPLTPSVWINDAVHRDSDPMQGYTCSIDTDVASDSTEVGCEGVCPTDKGGGGKDRGGKDRGLGVKDRSSQDRSSKGGKSSKGGAPGGSNSGGPSNANNANDFAIQFYKGNKYHLAKGDDAGNDAESQKRTEGGTSICLSLPLASLPFRFSCTLKRDEVAGTEVQQCDYTRDFANVPSLAHPSPSSFFLFVSHSFEFLFLFS